MQIATTPLGLADIGRWAGLLPPPGVVVVVFVLVAGIEFDPFPAGERGVAWAGSPAGWSAVPRPAASTSYVLSLGAAV